MLYIYCRWLIEKKNFEKNYKCFVVHILQVANGKKSSKKITSRMLYIYCRWLIEKKIWKKYKSYVVQHAAKITSIM